MPRKGHGEAQDVRAGGQRRALRRHGLQQLPQAAQSAPLRDRSTHMEITRRDMFSVGGKLLLIASVGATFEQIPGAEPQPDAYRMADPWWGMIIDIDKRSEEHRS